MDGNCLTVIQQSLIGSLFLVLRRSMQRETSMQELRDNRVSRNMKVGYKSGLNAIKKWIADHADASMIGEDGNIDLDLFGYNEFLQSIEWTVQHPNKKPGTLSGYRSALRHYYRDAGRVAPIEFDDDIKEIFQGKPVISN